MAKRLSKARRAKALNRSLVIGRAKANDDSVKMQQGAVQCALSRPTANYVMTLGRATSWESTGTKSRPSKQRWSAK